MNKKNSRGDIASNPIVNIAVITSLRRGSVSVGLFDAAKISPQVPSHASVLSSMKKALPDPIKTRLSSANPEAGKTPPTTYISDRKMHASIYTYSIKLIR
ncbi:hypothetical protein EMIT0196MI5_30061 [Pseudomonas sp. IT-196MI5]